MPNQIGLPTLEQPKLILTQQAQLPKMTLAATPFAALGDGITGALSSVAAALPELPVGVPAAAMPVGMPALPTGITEAFRSVEAALPAGMPKLTGMLGVTPVAAPVPGPRAATPTPSPEVMTARMRPVIEEIVS